MVAGVVGRRLLYHERDPQPWHKFCEPVDMNGLTVEEATIAARCDAKYGLFKPIGGLMSQDGTNVLEPNMIDTESRDNGWVVVRYPSYDLTNYEILGNATEQFNILDNREIARSLEPLLEHTRLTTVGLLTGGSRIFWSFLGDPLILRKPNGKEDYSDTFLNIHDCKLPGMTLNANFSAMRTECLNTYRMNDDQSFIKISHKISSLDILKWTVDALSFMAGQQKSAQMTGQAMLDARISDESVRGLIKQVYPIRNETTLLTIMKNSDRPISELLQQSYMDAAQESYTAHEKRMHTFRAAAWEAYEQDADYEGVYGTPWGAFQAVVNANCHYVSNPSRGSQTTKATMAFMFGERMKFTTDAWKLFSKKENWR